MCAAHAPRHLAFARIRTGPAWLHAPRASRSSPRGLSAASAPPVAGLAHDYVHGRGRFSTFMRPFGELFGGMSTTWWSNKHNMHHALTNEVGYDEDIALEPFIYL